MLPRLCDSSRALRRLAWGAVAVGIATPLVRHRLKLRPPVVTALSWPAPAALALAEPRTPLRDAGIYALQMWAYFAHYDMPDDDPDALMRRLRVDYPIRFDRALGLRHHADHPPPARDRPAGARGPARVRPLAGPLELVPGAARNGRLHPAAPPRASPALGRPDGGLLRPRLRGLLAGPDRAALVGRGEREHAPGASNHAGGRGAFLATPLAPALPFLTRQSVRRHALTPLRHVSDGRSHPVAGRARPSSPGMGVRADPRLRARLPGRALRDRPDRGPAAGGVASGASRRAWSRCSAPPPRLVQRLEPRAS